MIYPEMSVEGLWLEWLVTRQTSTGDGPRFIPEVAAVPQWFERCELGLAPLEAPSVFWTAENVKRINRTNRRVFLRAERKAADAGDRFDAEQRRTKWRAMLQVAEAA